MNDSVIDRLLASRMIEEVQADDDEVAALWRKAIESYGCAMQRPTVPVAHP